MFAAGDCLHEEEINNIFLWAADFVAEAADWAENPEIVAFENLTKNRRQQIGRKIQK